ncbi:hypothetical protein Acr_07g0014260 [Actinidia rufa]|uniref:Integrase catalytic domain-containing protein n=1 Tax=Actinidia rufa TaxID=165716 RepID=A0A7J0EXS8_9ERIC|nr:hypothetical protein Acr_07g0014260 [Actinidia rufa]
MHLRSRNLPRPSASSPPGNRSHPMANPGQAPDLESLHREIYDMAEQMRIMNENNGRLMQLLVAANPPLPAAPPVPDIERSRHSNRSGERSQNISANRIRDLDARLDAINTGTNAPVTVDTLIKQTEPPFTERILRARISSKFKLPAQLGIYEGKIDPMDHLDSYKSLMSLQGCSDEIMCKAFSATLKGPARSWFRKLSPRTIDSFGELSRLFVANFMSCRNRQKNASHLFTIHQKETESLKDFVKRFNQAILENKADKYIAAEELAEAKRRRRGKNDHKRKEPDTRRNDYREETRYKRPDRDPKRSNNRRPRTPPRRPEFILPPLNAPVAQKGGTVTIDQLRAIYTMIHGGFGSSGYSTSSKKRHARSAFRLAEEEIYNLSLPCVGDQPPITFSSDDLRGLHLPHDDALVVSAVIANFNVQRILIDSGNTTHPLGWINLPITLGTEPHQTTVWQDFIVVDCPSPYNAILGRPMLGIIKAITSTYHLKMKFPTLTGIGKVKGDQKVARQWFISAMKSQGDVPGIDPEVAMHKLFTKLEYSPVRQKRRKFAPERLKVIEDKISKLIKANVVREAHYPDWLANVVVAPKKGESGGFDATSKHELLSFMDAFSGYHQIKMYPPDVEKTSFITERGLYCYKTMEVYIDDMLVKSLQSHNHIAHLEEAFDILRRHRMMLNPSKCIFGVSSRKFLGFLVTKRGIEVNPDQIQALIAMRSPRNIREVQQLTGRVAALNRFVSKSADKCLPFFKILRKSQTFQWSEESENAFRQLKEYLESPPLLSVPTADEDLYVYLSASPTVISAVLVREEGKIQKPIYYVSKTLIGAEARYPRIEKIAYALMIAARKLCHCFQAHSIIVLIDQPLKQILQRPTRPDTLGRLLKWSIELSEFHIEYKPRTAIKAQALADFIVESTHEDTQPETTPLEMGIPKEPTSKKDLAHWILFVDGSSNQHGCGAGLVIRAPSGEQMEYAIRMGFQATNNEAEYEALLAGLRVATELGAQSFGGLQCIPLEFLTNPSIGVANQILQTEENPTWLDEIIAYLQKEILPKDKLQPRRLQYRSARFCIFKGRLYKRSFSGPLLRCLRPEEAEYVLREIHEGICGNHSGARSLAKKTIRQGYFWPIIERDAAAYIKRCDKCQRFAPVSRLPHTEMVPMSSPWPFAQWGIDILGPLPQAPLQRKFLIVAIDYFTKWIETQPLAKITEKNTRDFVWKHLVCRFRVPKVIISDNARQFDNDRFRSFCSDLAISHHFSSPGHPQANGQVEVTNRTILRNLKARLERSKSEWAENLPNVLWAYHTTSRIPMGETPYSMVFGTESVIPVEIGMPSFRISNFDKESNETELRLNLDLLEEKRENAELRQMAYKCQVAKYYNQRVRHRSFLPGDLVLRKVTLPTKEPNAGKLSPTWECPYKVVKVSRPGLTS